MKLRQLCVVAVPQGSLDAIDVITQGWLVGKVVEARVAGRSNLVSVVEFALD